MPAGRALRSRDVALLRDLADQTVVAFRNARLAAELSNELAQLAVRTDRLAESRRRLIRAGDAERDRLERAIVRDVVPHLLELPDRLVELAAGGPEHLDATAVQPLLADTGAALEALREITRGVYPAQLVRSGLEPALRSLLARTGTARLTVDALPPRDRTGPQVEGAAYFCVAEAARDLASVETVAVAPDGEQLVVRVAGSGRLDAGQVANMRDRAEAAGGLLRDLSEGDSTSWRRGCRWPRRPARGSAGGCRPRGGEPVGLELGLGHVAGRPGLHRERLALRRVVRRQQQDDRCVGRSRSTRVASRPSMPGRFTSMSTRCGRRAPATSMDSSPDAASPTTSKPTVASTTAVMARRNGSWSSTTRTRTGTSTSVSSLPHATRRSTRAGRTLSGGWPHTRPHLVRAAGCGATGAGSGTPPGEPSSSSS
jgi:hypothetical protein